MEIAVAELAMHSQLHVGKQHKNVSGNRTRDSCSVPVKKVLFRNRTAEMLDDYIMLQL